RFQEHPGIRKARCPPHGTALDYRSLNFQGDSPPGAWEEPHRGGPGLGVYRWKGFKAQTSRNASCDGPQKTVLQQLCQYKLEALAHAFSRMENMSLSCTGIRLAGATISGRPPYRASPESSQD